MGWAGGSREKGTFWLSEQCYVWVAGEKETGSRAPYNMHKKYVGSCENVGSDGASVGGAWDPVALPSPQAMVMSVAHMSH